MAERFFFNTQPDDGSIMAINRECIYTAIAPPNRHIYCDVYINYNYYKTLVSTSPVNGADLSALSFPFNTYYRAYAFNISPVVAEYMNFNMPNFNVGIDFLGENVNQTYVNVYVRIRGSDLINGVLVPEGPEPIQGTADTIPSGGGGEMSTVVKFLLASPSHEDHYIFETVLRQYGKKQIQFPIASPASTINLDSNRIYTLNTANTEKITFNDKNIWHFLVGNNGFRGFSAASCILKIAFFNEGGADTVITDLTGFQSYLHNYLYKINVALPFLLPGYPALGPYATTRKYYQLILVERQRAATPASIIAASPKYQIVKCDDDRMRIWFLNKWGVLQGVNFTAEYAKEMPVTGRFFRQQTKQRVNNFPVVYNEHSLRRYNPQSNDDYILSGVFTEEEVNVLRELFDSPVSYLEKLGKIKYTPLPGQTVPDLLVPCVITDATQPIRKPTERYAYDVSLKVTMSNPNIRQPV